MKNLSIKHKIALIITQPHRQTIEVELEKVERSVLPMFSHIILFYINRAATKPRSICERRSPYNYSYAIVLFQI